MSYKRRKKNHSIRIEHLLLAYDIADFDFDFDSPLLWSSVFRMENAIYLLFFSSNQANKQAFAIIGISWFGFISVAIIIISMLSYVIVHFSLLVFIRFTWTSSFYWSHFLLISTLNWDKKVIRKPIIDAISNNNKKNDTTRLGYIKLVMQWIRICFGFAQITRYFMLGLFMFWLWLNIVVPMKLIQFKYVAVKRCRYATYWMSM